MADSKRNGWRDMGWAVMDFARRPPDVVAAIAYALAILAGCGLLFFALTVFLQLLMIAVSFDLKADADAINKLLLALAGLLGAPFVVWRVVIASKQNQIAQENMQTTLFAKAVEQLGATREIKTLEVYWQRAVEKRDNIASTVPNIEVRLGAIYAL